MSDIFNALITSSDWRSVFLGLSGFVVGLIATSLTSKMLRQRLTAEQALAKRLHDYYNKRAQLEHLRRIANEIDELTEKNSGMLEEYVRLVDQMTRQLADAQKDLIAHALKQPSKQGRTLYLRRLAKEASQLTTKTITP